MSEALWCRVTLFLHSLLLIYFSRPLFHVSVWLLYSAATFNFFFEYNSGLWPCFPLDLNFFKLRYEWLRPQRVLSHDLRQHHLCSHFRTDHLDHLHGKSHIYHIKMLQKWQEMQITTSWTEWWRIFPLLRCQKQKPRVSFTVWLWSAKPEIEPEQGSTFDPVFPKQQHELRDWLFPQNRISDCWKDASLSVSGFQVSVTLNLNNGIIKQQLDPSILTPPWLDATSTGCFHSPTPSGSLWWVISGLTRRCRY